MESKVASQILGLSLPEKKHSQSLLQVLLAEKSEAERAKIREIVARTEVDEDDPLFLIMVSLSSIQVGVTDIPDQLKHLIRLFELSVADTKSQFEGFEHTAHEIVQASSFLERRLKTQIPKINQQRARNLKELAFSVAIAFLAGIIFGRPLLGAIKAVSCEYGNLCSPATAAEEKAE